MIRKGQLAAAILLLAATVRGGEAPLKVDTETRFKVENRYYALTIDATRGGAIRSFIYKPFDRSAEWIYPNGGGLLEDMIWQQHHPGELQEHRYDFKVLEQTADLFRVELWRAFAQEPYPGLVMRKQITLRRDSPAIQVTMTLENPTAKDVFPGAWVQNRFFGGGNKGVPVSYRPSYLGIRMSYYENGRGVGDEFVRRPTGGWAATFDRETGAGFLGLVDYNYLQQHYSCLSAYTMEFFFDRVLVRAGQSWSTDYTLVPVTGMHNCFYADDRVYVTAESKGDTVDFLIHATCGPVGETTVSIRASSSDRAAELAARSATFKEIVPDKPVTLPVAIPNIAKQPAIVNLSIASDKRQSSQEFQYSANPAFYHLQESAATYRAPLPRKVKPELASGRDLKLAEKAGLQVFYAYGLWHDLNRVREALLRLDPQATFDESVFRTGTLGPELSRQPLLAEELLGYDWVVMNNVGANALGEAGEIAVRQYVEAGGRLLVCGGVYSLGKSRWHESELADVLPVRVRPFWDMVELPAFTPLGDTLGSVRWVQIPEALKPDAKVELTAGDHPLLVSGAYGRGRVVVWFGTPMGTPPAGVTPYWEAAGWPEALANSLSKNGGK